MTYVYERTPGAEPYVENKGGAMTKWLDGKRGMVMAGRYAGCLLRAYSSGTMGVEARIDVMLTGDGWQTLTSALRNRTYQDNAVDARLDAEEWLSMGVNR